MRLNKNEEGYFYVYKSSPAPSFGPRFGVEGTGYFPDANR